MVFGNGVEEAEAHEQLNYAFDDAGLNFVDTAEMYPVPPAKDIQGRTDKIIGSWLRGRERAGVVLASKVAGYGTRSAFTRDNVTCTRVNRCTQIEESVDKSLTRLGTDYLDLLQVHWPERYVPLFGEPRYDPGQHRPDDVPFEEQLRGLEAVISAGKVRYIGVSNETSFGVCKFVSAAEQLGLPRIATIQNCYSLLQRGSFETDLAETCAPHNCNVSLLAYSPLAAGTLTGKYLSGGGPAEARLNRFTGYMARFNRPEARLAAEEYSKVAHAHGLTLTQLALAYVSSRWFVASTIIGATSLPQLKENVTAFEAELSAECIADVEAVYRRHRDPAFRDQ